MTADAISPLAPDKPRIASLRPVKPHNCLQAGGKCKSPEVKSSGYTLFRTRGRSGGAGILRPKKFHNLQKSIENLKAKVQDGKAIQFLHVIVPIYIHEVWVDADVTT